MTEELRTGDLLRIKRKEKKLSLRALGAKAKLTPAFLCDVELGRRSISLEALERVGEVLGLKIGKTSQDCPKCNGVGKTMRPGVLTPGGSK